MGLPQDLLAQAEYLAKRDRSKPKQANLRRAVSSAYYALFHLLTQESSAKLISGSGQLQLRNLVRRAYTHDEMKKAAKPFAACNLPRHLGRLLLTGVPPMISQFAQTFIDLQEERHRADYDISARLSRQQALVQVQRVQRAFQDWKSIRTTSEARVFLAALLLSERWKR